MIKIPLFIGFTFSSPTKSISVFLQQIRKRPLTDFTVSFNLPYLGTLPGTVTLLLRSFLLIWLVPQFLCLYLTALRHHLYH